MENDKHIELLVNILESRDQATIRSQVLESVLAFSKEEALSALQALETALTQSHKEEVEALKLQARDETRKFIPNETTTKELAKEFGFDYESMRYMAIYIESHYSFKPASGKGGTDE